LRKEDILMKLLSNYFEKWLNFQVNKIINIENKLHIREDLLEIYEKVINEKNSPIRRAYYSQTKKYYRKQFRIWERKARLFDPHKKAKKKLKIIVKRIDIVSDFLSGLNTLFTIFIIAIALPIIGIVIAANNIIANFLLIIPILLFSFKFYLYFLSTDSALIKQLNNILVLSDNENQDIFRKELRKIGKLMPAYVWNRSLCSSETLPDFITLLTIKYISIKTFEIIKVNLVNIIPKYLKEVHKFRNKVGLSIFIIKNIKLSDYSAP
jgi:hypothetical protein